MSDFGLFSHSFSTSLSFYLSVSLSLSITFSLLRFESSNDERKKIVAIEIIVWNLRKLFVWLLLLSSPPKKHESSDAHTQNTHSYSHSHTHTHNVSCIQPECSVVCPDSVNLTKFHLSACRKQSKNVK